MSVLLLLQLVLKKLCFNFELSKLLSKTLGFDPELLSLLLAGTNLLLHHYAPFDGLIVFGFHIFQRRCSVAGLPFKIIVGHLHISQLQLYGSI